MILFWSVFIGEPAQLSVPSPISRRLLNWDRYSRRVKRQEIVPLTRSAVTKRHAADAFGACRRTQIAPEMSCTRVDASLAFGTGARRRRIHIRCLDDEV